MFKSVCFDLLGFDMPVHCCKQFIMCNINSSPPGQNGRHFADDIFRCIFVNEKFHILIKISEKFVHKGPNDNNPAFVQIMTGHRKGDKPLFEPMLTWFTDAYMQH